MNPDLFSQLNTAFTAITAAGIFLAAWQLRVTKRQAITSFEDTIAREYRDLANLLPTTALLGEELPDAEYEQAFDELYHYVDLCNEQVFLRQLGRIRRQTWIFWRDGIRSNLRRPAFHRAWSEISQRSNGDFAELRRLIASDYNEDPKKWPFNRVKRCSRHLKQTIHIPHMNYVQIAQSEWLNLAFVISATIGGIGTEITVTFTLSDGQTKTARNPYAQLAAKTIQESSSSN